MTETLRQIAEDAFLLAHNIREGDLGEEVEASDTDFEVACKREWRTVELVIDLGERIARSAGIPDDALWKPDSLRDLIDAS